MHSLNVMASSRYHRISASGKTDNSELSRKSPAFLLDEAVLNHESVSHGEHAPQEGSFSSEVPVLPQELLPQAGPVLHDFATSTRESQNDEGGNCQADTTLLESRTPKQIIDSGDRDESPEKVYSHQYRKFRPRF